MSRQAQIERKTNETEIDLSLNLDGTGQSQIASGVGFLDHMLELFSRHSLIDLHVQARGDLHVDQHHTVEDIGICLGMGFQQALGNKAGIRRYGSLVLPMEEALAIVAVDLSGRFYLDLDAPIPASKIGDFDSELVVDFWHAFATHVPCNLHIKLLSGRNSHHICEAIFKGTGRALRAAVEADPRSPGIPSTKGTLG